MNAKPRSGAKVENFLSLLNVDLLVNEAEEGMRRSGETVMRLFKPNKYQFQQYNFETLWNQLADLELVITQGRNEKY